MSTPGLPANQLAATAADPYLALALDGVHLIEASAGTGKTFTLATLVTRLVVERGLRIGQVLAVTFTDAATQELRGRIRERLALTARVAAGSAQGEGAELAISRAVVERHLAAGAETRDQLARRLRIAEYETDLAAIFTIHGFCTRVLREHALACGQGFEAPTQLTSDAALREELAADLWRSAAVDRESASLLPALCGNPESLAADLRQLLSRDRLMPAPAMPGADPLPRWQASARALCEALAAHGDDARGAVERAFEAKTFDGRRAKRPSFDKAWATLCAGGIDNGWSREDPGHLEKLLPTTMQGLCKDGQSEQVPRSPVFDALADWVDADDACIRARHARAAALLHEVRTDAHQRATRLKRVRRLQTYDDLIDGVADALAGPGGDALADALRLQYRFALVDEFQDTDSRQWAIFRRVFGSANNGAKPALLLIGDPKQAIYGFRGGDVHTYLQARRHPGTELAPALEHNFRSRPALLEAIDALYRNARQALSETGQTPFGVDNIEFASVRPGGKRADADYLRGGQAAPALTVRAFDCQVETQATGKHKGRKKMGNALSVGCSRERASAACVAAIHQVLSDARQGRATRKSRRGDPRPVRAGDIAVLVRNHSEATLIQRGLSAVNVPAVAAGKQSLFASDEASELLAVLAALLQPGDDGRLRAALATVLLGEDAAAIAALDAQPDAHARHQRDAHDWRERWQRSGPLALVSDLCAAHAERLLGLVDGERRLTNYLQLGELLQEAQARLPGLHAQLDWLRLAIADADKEDDAQLLRLETDADRVQIVTLHKSKGLEYPLVFLPFAGIGRKSGFAGRHCTIHDGHERVLHWKVDKDASDWQRACDDHDKERAAEDARLLYVGLTRARDALWLAVGPFHNALATPLWPMLEDLDALRGLPAVVVESGEAIPARVPLAPAGDPATPAARVARRPLSRDWWVYSFTQLIKSGAGERDAAHAVATTNERGAQDEPPVDPAAAGDAEPAAFDPRFAGSRFGDVLHDAFEHVDFAAWRDWRSGPAPDGQGPHLRAALRRGGYLGGDLDDGISALTPLVGHGLTVELPERVRLCDLPPGARRAEMEFHFAMQPTSVDALVGLLHQHGVLRERNGFGARQRLEGLMTGKIDLTYHADGRWYLLDYKSNRLPGYGRAALDAAMAHSGYDLQALIYTVALHRWLRFRLGDGYDYARDFGGARYLFCRGLADGDGIHDHTPAPELVHALDALFAGDAT